MNQNYGTLYDTVQAERKRYLDKEIDHSEYYLWLSDLIGLSESLIPASAEEVQRALYQGEHLNNIPLRRWDSMDGAVRGCASRAGLRVWSLSETVCCLKAMALRRAEKTAVVNWQKIGVYGDYTAWSYTEDDGRPVYNVTKDGNPPKSDGGYYELEYLLRTKEWSARS